MNKSELVDRVVDATELSKADTQKVIDNVMSVITSALQNGEEVNLTGFGKFHTSERKESEGRNPRTGEKIKIPAKIVGKFTFGKTFKDAISEGETGSKGSVKTKKN